MSKKGKLSPISMDGKSRIDNLFDSTAFVKLAYKRTAWLRQLLTNSDYSINEIIRYSYIQGAHDMAGAINEKKANLPPQ